MTTSCLIGAIVDYRRSLVFLPLCMVFVFAGKIFISSLILSLPEVIGAAIGIGLWFALGHRRRAVTLLAVGVLCCAIVVARLEPFHFAAPARAFGWLPFRSFLAGSLAVNTMSFLEKFFLYGSLVWLATDAGLSLRSATLLVALLLFVSSIVEIYLPGRSAEITDTVIVLTFGLVMAPLRQRAG